MKDINISTMEQLIKSLNELPTHYIYRGHSDGNWRLQSTLERILGGKFETESEKYENYALNLFKSKFHLYDKLNDKPKTKLEWLSIMQHYGVPTRMIDFTVSPYVALYFALENAGKTADKSFAVYAIDYRELQEISLTYIKKKDKTVAIEYSDLPYKQDDLFNNIIDKFSYEILWVIEPTISNLRLDRQSGCFLISGCKGLAIEGLLSSAIYTDIKSFKFIIPGILWDHIYTLLEKMNINSKTIYGDLKGLSKSIELFIKAYT
jgi:hypothetical protein